MTLGEMKNALDKYKASFINGLKQELAKLNKLRRRYAHHVFSGLDDWDKVMSDAEKGLEINSKGNEAAFHC